MSKVKDKAPDIMSESQVENGLIQSTEKHSLACRVQELFRGSYEAKDQMDLMNRWSKYDAYKHSNQNPVQSPDHPGSMTNIIHPIIESQISDLTDKPFSTTAEGREPGDDMFSDDVQQMMDFILERNRFNQKLDMSEHDRLELGTSVVKTYFDSNALDGKGLPSFEIISPANFFPDPKWTAAHLLQECEFVIHAVARPLSWIRRKFKLGKHVVRETTCPYDPDLDSPNFKTDEVEVATSQKALLIECYFKDIDGSVYCVHVANHIVLEDSREVLKDKKLQRKDKFPFVAIPCYVQRGTGWGQGDVELLIPTQDLINELDDQIRMNARLMGNPQITVGRGAGKHFDIRKWTNKPGLRIPMVDQNAFQVVPGVNISSDVVNRREKAFEEANIISGRPDVSRGETSGQIVAAKAIIALQQAGQKQVIHKARMWKFGWAEVLELLFDEMMDNWDESTWIRIQGDKPDFKFMSMDELRNVPIMVPVLNPGEGEDSIKELTESVPMMDGEEPMLDEFGQAMMNTIPMTREAEFDLSLSIGDGLPSDKAFVYQTMLDLSSKMVEGMPVVSWQELRNFLRGNIGIELESDEDMIQKANPPMPPMPNMPMPGGMPNAI